MNDEKQKRVIQGMIIAGLLVAIALTIVALYPGFLLIAIPLVGIAIGILVYDYQKITS